MTEVTDKTARYKFWYTRLEKERKAHRKFQDAAKEASKAARDDGQVNHTFNIHWANCNIIRAAIYSSLPKADVRRRFDRPNPTDKELARLVERAIEYQVDTTDFDHQSNATVKDFVEAGLGVPRVVMDVDIEETEVEGLEEPLQRIVGQSVSIEHVPFAYFHWEPGKSWDQVDWIAFESYRPRKELEREYGVKMQGGKDFEAEKREAEDYADEVQVFEIWHKPSRKIIVLAATHNDILEEREDQLQLQGFYPVPMPMMSNIKSNELIPKPDYEFIKAQVVELNVVSSRISKITRQIKAVGYYDANMSELGRLLESADGTLVPVSGLQGQVEGRPSEAVTYVPLAELITTVRELEAQRDAIKGVIYETIGISDIVRGQSRASETAAAQNLKGQWANVRLSEKIKAVESVWREVFRMFTEIICEHFSPELLSLQTGIQITPEMYQIMKDDITRSYSIDVETDSTIAQDDLEERQQSMEMIDVLLGRMEQMVPGVQSGALPVPLVQEILLFMISKHKHGKQLEDAVMEMGPHLQGMQQFQQQMEQMQQQLMQQQQQLEQAGQQIQEMGKALESADQREAAREDAKVQSDIQDKQSDNVRADAEAQADIEKTRAETVKIYREAMTPVETTWQTY